MGSQADQVTPPSAVLRPRAPRAPLVHAVLCRSDDAPQFVEVTSLNISQSGMLVRGAVLPPVHSSVQFKFILETGLEILSGTGTVIRHASAPDGGTTCGIAFGDIDPSKQRILARVIELHLEAAADTSTT